MPISNYTKKKVPKTLKIVEKPKPKAKPEPKKKLKPKTLKIVEKKPAKAMAPKKKVPKTLRIKEKPVAKPKAKPKPKAKAKKAVTKPKPFEYPADYSDYVEDFVVGAGAGEGAGGGAGAGAGSSAPKLRRAQDYTEFGTPDYDEDSNFMDSMSYYDDYSQVMTQRQSDWYSTFRHKDEYDMTEAQFTKKETLEQKIMENVSSILYKQRETYFKAWKKFNKGTLFTEVQFEKSWNDYVDNEMNR